MATLSLAEAFALIPDPRDRRGRQHPLVAMLCLSAVAILAGCRSLQAIAQFGRDHGIGLAHALGFRKAKTPAASTFCELFRGSGADGHLAERVSVGLAGVGPGGAGGAGAAGRG